LIPFIKGLHIISEAPPILFVYLAPRLVRFDYPASVVFPSHDKPYETPPLVFILVPFGVFAPQIFILTSSVMDPPRKSDPPPLLVEIRSSTPPPPFIAGTATGIVLFKDAIASSLHVLPPTRLSLEKTPSVRAVFLLLSFSPTLYLLSYILIIPPPLHLCKVMLPPSPTPDNPAR